MLNRYEKLAIYNLIVLAVAILVFILIWQTMGISKATAGLAVFAFHAIGRLLFLRKKNSSEVLEDERDISIQLKSVSRSFYFMSMYFMVTTLAVYFSHSQEVVVSIDILPVFLWGGWAVNVLASSIIVLVQYRRGVNCGTC